MQNQAAVRYDSQTFYLLLFYKTLRRIPVWSKKNYIIFRTVYEIFLIFLLNIVEPGALQGTRQKASVK